MGFLDRVSKTLYVKLYEARLVVRAVGTDGEVDTAEKEAIFDPELLRKAFGHPRLIVGDFKAAELLVAIVIRELYGRKELIKPAVIVHILHPFGDDLTNVEVRALLDVVERAGARRVFLWWGRDLQDNEMQARRFPAEGRVIRDLDPLYA